METPRALDPSLRLRVEPAATRRLGDDLLINSGGATAPVHRLVGAGSELWWAFAAGLSVREAAVYVGEGTSASLSDVEAQVAAFAAELVRVGLAEPTP
jgi:hypothetical protein